MGRGSKAKKSQGPRFTEQNMPSKTPIVIPTLNKALGSKSVRGHKHLKLTFGLSQGLFFWWKAAQYSKVLVWKIWNTLGYLQLEINGSYRVNLVNKGYQTLLWNNTFKEVHTTSLASQTSMTLALSGKESLGNLRVCGGQGLYLNHDSCYSWSKYPWKEVAQSTLSLEQELHWKGRDFAEVHREAGRVKAVTPKSRSRGVIQMISLS